MEVSASVGFFPHARLPVSCDETRELEDFSPLVEDSHAVLCHATTLSQGFLLKKNPECRFRLSHRQSAYHNFRSRLRCVSLSYFHVFSRAAERMTNKGDQLARPLVHKRVARNMPTGIIGKAVERSSDH